MCSEHRPQAPARLNLGYTMVELVVVLVLVGVLAAFAVPKLQAGVNFRDDTWRDSLLAGIRYAQKTAVSHRRLVCGTVSSTTLTLRIASANPATDCNTDLQSPGGSTGGVFATAESSAAATTVSPSGVLYFQPDGRVTTDGAGTTATSRTLTMSGASSITLTGETGYVQ